MLIPNNNLIAVAYKTGYCGTFMYSILALSPEVAQYEAFDDILVDGTGSVESHGEQWFRPTLHFYEDSYEISNETWPSYITPAVAEALKSSKLVIFRCHPNVAYKLSFLKNFRVIYMTHANSYVPERWAYEKAINPKGDSYYTNALKKLLKTDKDIQLNDTIKRNLLIRNINHDVVPAIDFINTFNDKVHEVKIEEFLDTTQYIKYLDICNFLNITPIKEDRFIEIIKNYNERQWKRF